MADELVAVFDESLAGSMIRPDSAPGWRETPRRTLRYRP
jgi:hypothetical protein